VVLIVTIDKLGELQFCSFLIFSAEPYLSFRFTFGSCFGFCCHTSIDTYRRFKMVWNCSSVTGSNLYTESNSYSFWVKCLQ